ncbi:MAG: YchJ family protein [Spirochaetia bacterium]|nr:YchJ family protein [Spirochaetia bacterium]
MPKQDCPCGSGRDYADCCSPIIHGKALAPSAEALMRSRYSAYALGETGWIMKSCVTDEGVDPEATAAWSRESKWLGLRILSVEKGGAADSEGVVVFEATYERGGLRDVHRERAEFRKIDGAWLYDEGEIEPTTVVRAVPKVGRNDPCPCGSGKKYKQCCGR